MRRGIPTFDDTDRVASPNQCGGDRQTRGAGPNDTNIRLNPLPRRQVTGHDHGHGWFSISRCFPAERLVVRKSDITIHPNL